MKELRDYFETGCICILNGSVHVVPSEGDEEASDRYMNECECSRHPEGV